MNVQPIWTAPIDGSRIVAYSAAHKAMRYCKFVNGVWVLWDFLPSMLIKAHALWWAPDYYNDHYSYDDLATTYRKLQGGI